MGNGSSQVAATRLVERARAGDERAFAELVHRYRDRIVALALHLTGSESEAEDIAQEVFLKAYVKLPTFEGRSHFFTWVYRIAINRALNTKRAEKRRKETDLHDSRVVRALEVDAPDNPRLAAELRSTYARLLVALDALPASMRTSVVLCTMQGLSHGEAAVVQECSEGTVAWRIHEARKRLREAVANGGLHPRPLSPELTRLLKDWMMPVPSNA